MEYQAQEAIEYTIEAKEDTAYLASGCFWGTQYYLDKAKGVESTEVGYTGGNVINPTYKEVCTGRTGHVETVKVIYNPAILSFEKLLHLYYETHDFTQEGGQGPDIGTQYRSVIFYTSPQQKATAENVIKVLTKKGYKVATALEPASRFWKAEDYHQDYYDNNGKRPYCHVYRQIF